MKELPFDVEILDTEPQEVRNTLSGKSTILQPDAIAVYDTIKGAEMLGDYKTVQKGVDWFIENYPEEYMILLD